MGDGRVLDPAIIKDLSNHIYEKRKATAFQIESFTKSALSRNESQTIYKIIDELSELTNSGTNSAKMGAITALGSVSVALGSIAIAYFLDKIIKPIFATFKDTDARVRYYACESLYNIAKIARGEILVYFNEVFDILSILVTDSESSVKNAADILDRLIKDIVSAKATNYVSIIYQKEPVTEITSHLVDANGVAIQVNHPQDAKKAFSLPKFIPTLLERMYVLDPYCKKFMLSWLELLDDIPTLELISFLPTFLEPLIKFLMNNAPDDVRMDTENMLNQFLVEMQGIARVRHEKRRKQRDTLRLKEKGEKPENDKDGSTEHEVDNEAETVTEKQAEKEKSTDNDKLEIGKAKANDKTKTTDKDKESTKEQHNDPNKSFDSAISNLTTVIHTSEAKPDHIEEPDDNESHVDGVEDDENDEENDEFVTGQDIYLDYPKMIEILLTFLRHSPSMKLAPVDLSGEPHDIVVTIQEISLTWLEQILNISPSGFVNLLPQCLTIIIRNIATTEQEKDFDLRNLFLGFSSALQQFLVSLKECNDESQLQGLTPELYDDFVESQLPQLIKTITDNYTATKNDFGKITCLEWLEFLYAQNPKEYMTVLSDRPFKLGDLLRSSSNDVASKSLELFAVISEDNDSMFNQQIEDLLHFFHTQYQTNKPRIELVVRKLCTCLPSQRVYSSIAGNLNTWEDLDFVNAMVSTLNTILLTSNELGDLRKRLRALDVYKMDDWQIFATLFQSWCHSATSALSLCLLTSNYELAYLIIKNISEQEVSYQLLMHLDILVQLIESPIFLKLRMQLLEPEKQPYLYKTLYGLLMILPQSSTYSTLQNRLTSVATLLSSTAATATPTPAATTPSALPQSTPSSLSIRKKRIYEMLDKFIKVQEQHEHADAVKKEKEDKDKKQKGAVPRREP
ncbi:hypothetical protein DIURU_004234 [Diutina rugosa]|uniref:Vacuolar protein 14 C-terminal Fig4-binding domain-containing protein n=1 Tax=Diutina rugosa TaxID=5481 RepID=A0A642UIA6_DIURU|nr:uncharacterized protein DIURU_004234 [Diutina rugosa]KAA8899567.1 hypothetical protein DIURU_004234 [Diutina rugosa]